MAKLTTKARNKLPAGDFAGPGRSYPVEDASHAKNAKARASQAENAGRMSKAEESKIDAKANTVLGAHGNGHSRGTQGTAASPHRPRAGKLKSY